MLQKIVATVLNKILGDFIEELDQNKLKLSIFKGSVVLKNLILKPDALNRFNLPIYVKSGFLGTLHLEIPWKNLKSKPVIVNLDKIFLIAGQQEYKEYKKEKEETFFELAKQKKLEAYEIWKQNKEAEKLKKSKSKKSESDDPGFTEKLIAKIIDNLQISISNVHVRFESEIDKKPFAMGVTLDAITAQSADENWKPAFVENNPEFLNKIVDLKHLSIYWDTNTEPLKDLSTSSVTDFLQKTLPKKGSKSNTPHQFILNPVDGDLKLRMKKTPYKKGDSLTIPKFDAITNFHVISIGLEDEHYRSILKLMEHFTFFMRGEKYRKFLKPKYRPKKDNTIISNQWWRFIFRSAGSDYKERNSLFDWKELTKRINLRKKYIPLWKKKFDYKNTQKWKQSEEYQKSLILKKISHLKQSFSSD
ncbi:vacuolar protein sorting-associated protein 13a-related [Anaeramoeba ignava]|uniref:Vacuolar protein sorting-associated protein 13a-related n=1 Tax=Anaeramoeba ignava TaxID=1746090 RepID=A0A9Q0R4T3_ANAIG|nr:vacuolar protein sorting-associated protein 13a-related [Anaeramoeba ignava]